MSIKFSNGFLKYITELRELYGKRKKGEWVIHYKGFVWRVDEDTPQRVLISIANKIGIKHEEFSINYLVENRPDVFVGEIFDDWLIIEHYTSYSITSKTLEKILAHYNLKGVSYNNDEHDLEDEYYRHDIKTQPVIYYHGTIVKHLPNIMKYGLRPNDNINWPNVGQTKIDLKWNDRIFLTTHLDAAIFHATRNAIIQKSEPIIIGVEIPDKSKIIPDFDMVSDFNDMDAAIQHDYHHFIMDGGGYDDLPDKFAKRNDITHSTGFIAYKGRIPSSFIKTMIYTTNPTDKTMSKRDDRVQIWSKEEMQMLVKNYVEYDIFPCHAEIEFVED